MDARDKEILEQFARQVVPELQSVTGSFGASIRSGVNGNALIIDGHPHIGVLIYGRGPTTSGARRGNPPLSDLILDWVNRNNIQPRGGDISKESLAFLITRSVHENGTRLYQEIKRGGKPKDIFGHVLTPERINNLLTLLSDNYEKIVVSDLLKNLRQ